MCTEDRVATDPYEINTAIVQKFQARSTLVQNVHHFKFGFR